MVMLLFSLLISNPRVLSSLPLQRSLVCILQLHLGVLGCRSNPHVPAVLRQPRLHLHTCKLL